jgi:hypothetical protein
MPFLENQIDQVAPLRNDIRSAMHAGAQRSMV